MLQARKGTLCAVGGDRLGVGEEGLVNSAGVSDVLSLRVFPIHLKTKGCLGFGIYTKTQGRSIR